MENKVNIGELDTLVVLQQPTQTTGSVGEKIITYSAFRSVYAKIDKVIDESVSDSNLASEYRLTATVYKVSSLTTRWRVSIGGKPYGITGIDTIARWSPFCTLTLTAIDG